jgi:indole-3-glycerol phosphate synthase
VQAQSAGVTLTGTLGRLVAAARKRVSLELQPLRSELRAAAERAPRTPGFRAAVKAGSSVQIIAELKRRSPSQGMLRRELDIGPRAREYADGGAAALSILTEKTEFGGSLSDLTLARASVALPLLRKDFHVDPLQLCEARISGASAVLLIARVLGKIGLKSMLNECASVGLEALVEVRTREELLWALDLGARCVGVNARNLETLAVEPKVIAELLPQIPTNVCAVAESGLADQSDVERVAGYGADAALVGSALSRADNGAIAVRALTGVRREASRAG